MGISLYELTANFRLLRDRMEAVAEANCGEIDDTLESILSDLDVLGEAREDKIRNSIIFIREQTAEAEAIDSEIKRLTGRRNALRSNCERLREYIDFNMDPTEKFKFDVGSVYKTRSEKTVFTGNPNDLPDQYKKVEVSARLSEIKAAIKAGAYIENARLEENYSLVIR